MRSAIVIALLFVCCDAQAGLVWHTQGKNITSIAFATNPQGQTVSYTDAATVHFLTLIPASMQVNPLWVYKPPSHPNGTDVIHVFGARHTIPNVSYNLTAASIDNVVAALYNGEFESFELFGVTTSSPHRDIEWHYTVQGGFIDDTLDFSPLIAFCDDGSTVVSVVNARIWSYLHAVSAQPGHPLSECYLRIGLHNPLSPPGSLATDSNGTLVVVSIGKTVRTFDTIACKEIFSPVSASGPLTSPVVMAPDGQHVVIGAKSATIYVLDNARKTFVPSFAIGNATDPWSLQRAAFFSSNNTIDMVALIWLSRDALQVKVSAHSLRSTQQLWAWTSARNPVGNPTTITAVATQGVYVVVSSTGGLAVPSLVLFSSASSTPLFAPVSATRHLDVDILVVFNSTTPVVFVAAAGHAEGVGVAEVYNAV